MLTLRRAHEDARAEEEALKVRLARFLLLFECLTCLNFFLKSTRCPSSGH